MPTIPVVPLTAEDPNYAAGVDPWSGQPTKVTPPGGYVSKGWTPGQPIGAEYENSHKYNTAHALLDSQARAIVKAASAGAAFSSGHRYYLQATKVAIGSTSVAGTEKIGAYSPDLVRSAITADTQANLIGLSAYYNDTIGGGSVVMWSGQLFGSVGTCALIQDTKARTLTVFTPPQVNARYVDGCTDSTSGHMVLLSAVNPGVPQYGFASGNPSLGLTFVAAPAGTGWVSDNGATVASKPGETRAFSVAKSFATADGGATLSATVDTAFSGGLPVGSTLFRPTWDGKFARWVASTCNVSVDAATAISSTRVWTSADGVTWTQLVIPTNLIIWDVLYYRGWLWAIAQPIDTLSAPTADQRVIYYSTDGGLTWTRTGITLSLRVDRFPIAGNAHRSRIVAMDSSLLFQTVRDSLADGDLEYCVLQIDAVV